MNVVQIDAYLANKGIWYDASRDKFRMESLSNNKWRTPEQMFRELRKTFGIKQALKLMLTIIEVRQKHLVTQTRNR